MGQLSGVYVDDGYSDRSGGVCSAGERPGSDRTAVLAIPSACRSSPSSRTSSGVVTISAYPSRISRCDPLLVALVIGPGTAPTWRPNSCAIPATPNDPDRYPASTTTVEPDIAASTRFRAKIGRASCRAGGQICGGTPA